MLHPLMKVDEIKTPLSHRLISYMKKYKNCIGGVGVANIKWHRNNVISYTTVYIE